MQDTPNAGNGPDALVPAGAEAAEAGFVMPVSLTCAAWAECVAWSDEDSRRQLVQSERARLERLLEMSAHAFSLCAVPSEGILFPVFRVPRDGHSTEFLETTLRAVLVTDRGEPLVVIMLRHEG